MKKTAAFTILSLVLVLLLVSCKKDSNENSIISKWRVTEMGSSFYLAGNLVLDLPSAPVSGFNPDDFAFVFNSDSTYSQYLYFNNQYKLIESGNKYTLTDANNTLKLYSTSTNFVDIYKISFTDKNTMILIHTDTYNPPSGIETPTLSAKYDLYKKTYTLIRQ